MCFGGFRPTKLVEEPRALARGAPLWDSEIEDPDPGFVETLNLFQGKVQDDIT